MDRVLKVVLAILLFLCLFDFPYGYYQFVRFFSAVVFVYFGLKESNNTYRLIFFALAILFQPIIKISLGRELWNVVDVIVGVFLMYLVFNNKSNDK